MLIPKRTKYRKQHRPVRSGMSKGGNEINFGDFAIQSLAPAYVTKGAPEFWIANVRPGRVMFEIGGVSEDIAKEALRRAIDKLPMKCRIIAREGGDI